jgi:hypothetical protein
LPAGRQSRRNTDRLLHHPEGVGIKNGVPATVKRELPFVFSVRRH